MSVATAKQLLDQKIADLTAQLDQAKALRAAFDNEQLMGIVSGLMNGALRPTRKLIERSPASASLSNREKIAAFFKAHDNAWASSAEIMQGAGVERGIVNNVLYVGNPEDFESKDHPTLKRRKLWRMKHAAAKDS